MALHEIKTKNIISSINNFAGTKDEGFLKTLLTNKFVIGSALIASGTMAVKAVKTISLTGLIYKIIPHQIFNVTLEGIPVGGMAGLALGGIFAGTLIAQGLKISIAFKSCKTRSEIFDVIVEEGVSAIILIFTLILLGQIGMELYKSVVNMPTMPLY